MLNKIEDLEIHQLIKIRDTLIDKNLESISEFGQDIVQERKNLILNSEFGLVTYINKTYSNLTEKEKLIKQINIIEYLNSINDTIDPSGDFFEGANEMYQISQYLIQKGKDPAYFKSYESLNFLIDNLQDVCNFVDYDGKDVVKSIDPSIKIYLSDEQKVSLDKNLKRISLSNNVDEKIRNVIKDLQDNSNITENKLKQPLQIMDSPSPRVTQSSYRQNALAYARKHGYTNGYYGSTNRKNNAPSPYYNFQKDGYGDCANFVSQCLRAGGVTFWTNNNPWYYYSTSKRSPSWAGARAFKLHWMKRVPYQTLTVKDTLSFLKPGTPISICREDGVATHTLICTDRHSNGYNFSYAAHSDEGDRTNLLKKLNRQLISYYKVYW